MLRLDKKLEGAKMWTGSPMAMILKASMGMLQPTSNVPLQQGCRIPENARVQFATLMQLYSRHIPQSTVSTTVTLEGGGKDAKKQKKKHKRQTLTAMKARSAAGRRARGQGRARSTWTVPIPMKVRS